MTRQEASEKDGLVYRSHYAADTTARARLDDLIESTFNLDLGALTAFDFQDPSFTPFSYFDEGGACVANVGVYAMPLVLEGRRVDALALQSVCTAPAWRMKGLFRDLVTHALNWCDERTDLIILKTDTPSLYHRFGFKTRPQSRFRMKTAGATPDRSLKTQALDIRGDAEFVKRLFRNRAPVSRTMALLDYGTMFFLEVALDPGFTLRYLPAFDAIMVTCKAADGTLQIDNIVGRDIPPLSALLGALDEIPEIIEFGFPPDRLAVEVEVTHLEQIAQIMTRGPFLSDRTPVRVPASGI